MAAGFSHLRLSRATFALHHTMFVVTRSRMFSSFQAAALRSNPLAMRHRWFGSMVPQENPNHFPVVHDGRKHLADINAVEVSEAATLKSSQLRKLAEAAAEEGGSPAVWEAIGSRCEVIANELHYWDAVIILQSFTKAGIENRSLLLALAEALCWKSSQFVTKHVLNIFAVYETWNLRPRALYVELFHSLIGLSKSMYAEEVSLSLQMLARYELGNPTVLLHLMSAVNKHIKDFRMRYLCGVVGALGHMEACPPSLLEVFDKQAKFNVDTVAIQELMDDLVAFPMMEFSWAPYEQLCRDEFLSRVKHLQLWSDVDQFRDPFETFFLLRTRGWLHREFLEALIQWCLYGVHQPNVRTSRRPTSKQLVWLYDEAVEWDLEGSEALQDAIQYYVESGGGLWPVELPKPLRWRRKRTYNLTPDPLDGMMEKGVRYSRGVKPLPPLEGGLPKDPKPAERLQRKPSEGEIVRTRVTSRKGPRPRHRRDPGLQRRLRTDHPRTPFYMQNSPFVRPRYMPGTAYPGYPYKGRPTGKAGASYVLRW